MSHLQNYSHIHIFTKLYDTTHIPCRRNCSGHKHKIHIHQSGLNPNFILTAPHHRWHLDLISTLIGPKWRSVFISCKTSRPSDGKRLNWEAVSSDLIPIYDHETERYIMKDLIHLDVKSIPGCVALGMPPWLRIKLLQQKSASLMPLFITRRMLGH